MSKRELVLAEARSLLAEFTGAYSQYENELARITNPSHHAMLQEAISSLTHQLVQKCVKLQSLIDRLEHLNEGTDEDALSILSDEFKQYKSAFPIITGSVDRIKKEKEQEWALRDAQNQQRQEHAAAARKKDRLDGLIGKRSALIEGLKVLLTEPIFAAAQDTTLLNLCQRAKEYTGLRDLRDVEQAQCETDIIELQDLIERLTSHLTQEKELCSQRQQIEREKHRLDAVAALEKNFNDVKERIAKIQDDYKEQFGVLKTTFLSEYATILNVLEGFKLDQHQEKINRLRQIHDQMVTCFAMEFSQTCSEDTMEWQLLFQSQQEQFYKNKYRELQQYQDRLRHLGETLLREAKEQELNGLLSNIRETQQRVTSLSEISFNQEEMDKYLAILRLAEQAKASMDQKTVLAFEESCRVLRDLNVRMAEAVAAVNAIIGEHEKTKKHISENDFLPLIKQVNSTTTIEQASTCLERIDGYVNHKGKMGDYARFFLEQMGAFASSKIPAVGDYLQKRLFNNRALNNVDGISLKRKLNHSFRMLLSLYNASPRIDHRLFWRDTASFRAVQWEAVTVLARSGLLNEPYSVQLNMEDLRKQAFCEAVFILKEAAIFTGTAPEQRKAQQRLVQLLIKSPFTVELIRLLAQCRQENVFLGSPVHFNHLMSTVMDRGNEYLPEGVYTIWSTASRYNPLPLPMLMLLLNVTTKINQGMQILLGDNEFRVRRANMIFLTTLLVSPEIKEVLNRKLEDYLSDMNEEASYHSREYNSQFFRRLTQQYSTYFQALVDYNQPLRNTARGPLLRPAQRYSFPDLAVAMDRINIFVHTKCRDLPSDDSAGRDALRGFQLGAMTILLNPNLTCQKIKAKLDKLAVKQFKGDALTRLLKDVLSFILTLGIGTWIYGHYRQRHGKTFFRYQAVQKQAFADATRELNLLATDQLQLPPRRLR